MLGKAELVPSTPLKAGQIGTWELVYTVGAFGIDDLGSIIITRRSVSDWEIPQMDRPRDSGYVTASTDGEASLEIWYDSRYYIRPWRCAIVVKVYDGSLKPGEQVVVTLGDTSGGSPGIRCQTFPQRRHRFRVLVDPFGTGRYKDLDQSPEVSILPADFSRLEVCAPSFVHPNETFELHVRALDRHGNPTPAYAGPVVITTGLPDDPARVQGELAPVDQGVASVLVGPLPVGTHRLHAEAETGEVALSNPILCAARHPAPRLLWGDLHGQTEETVGTGSVEEYYAFARDKARLDVCSWQGNDFQITQATWQEVRRQTERFHSPGNFVTLLGYEWSGLTPNGGDHNIYFLDDEEQVLHSTKWLVWDDWGGLRHRVSDLWEALKERGKAMAVPHVGGRHANFDFYDPDLIRVIEIHSHHGTFEWFARDALRRGLKVGFIAGSDDHTGRPGLTLPTGQSSRGFVSFDVKGGLVGIYARDQTREAIWEALFDRRCYATSGERILLWTQVDGHPMGSEYAGTTYPQISGWVEGTDSIWEVELRRGTQVIHRFPLLVPAEDQPRRRVKIEWSGVRTRGRLKKTRWDGGLTVSGARIVAAEDFAMDRASDGIQQWSGERVAWRSSTSGDVDGVILDLDAGPGAEIAFESPPIAFGLRVDDLAWEPRIFDAGGVNQRVRVSLIGAGRGEVGCAFSYTDTDPQPGLNSYWVRVLQRDGAMAWSSPVFYTYQA